MVMSKHQMEAAGVPDELISFVQQLKSPSPQVLAAADPVKTEDDRWSTTLVPQAQPYDIGALSQRLDIEIAVKFTEGRQGTVEIINAGGREPTDVHVQGSGGR